jgi:hypothetical protein
MDAVPGQECQTNGERQELEWVEHCGKEIATMMCDCEENSWMCMSVGLGLCEMTGPDCSAVSCVKPECNNEQILVTPEGKCCPTCRQRQRPVCNDNEFLLDGECISNCAAVRCASAVCEDGQFKYKTREACCDSCHTFPEPHEIKSIANCAAVSCIMMVPKCNKNQFTYTAEGECCPACHDTRKPASTEVDMFFKGPERDGLATEQGEADVGETKSESGPSAALVSYVSELLAAAGQALGKTEDELELLVAEMLSKVNLTTILAKATNYAEAAELLVKSGEVQDLVEASGMDVDAVVAQAATLENDDDAGAGSAVASLAAVALAVVGATVC